MCPSDGEGQNDAGQDEDLLDTVIEPRDTQVRLDALRKGEGVGRDDLLLQGGVLTVHCRHLIPLFLYSWSLIKQEFRFGCNQIRAFA